MPCFQLGFQKEAASPGIPALNGGGRMHVGGQMLKWQPRGTGQSGQLRTPARKSAAAPWPTKRTRALFSTLSILSLCGIHLVNSNPGSRQCLACSAPLLRTVSSRENRQTAWSSFILNSNYWTLKDCSSRHSFSRSFHSASPLHGHSMPAPPPCNAKRSSPSLPLIPLAAWLPISLRK